MSTGLFSKYTVERADHRDEPGEKHDGCEYFVLDVTHDPHAMKALEAYALACQKDNPALAEDITRVWLAPTMGPNLLTCIEPSVCRSANQCVYGCPLDDVWPVLHQERER